MNKYQDALDWLRDGNDSCGTEWDLLQELVDKMVPCKPVYDKFYSYEFKCQCGGHVSGHEEFCPDCGQVLDWSE